MFKCAILYSRLIYSNPPIVIRIMNIRDWMDPYYFRELTGNNPVSGKLITKYLDMLTRKAEMNQGLPRVFGKNLGRNVASFITNWGVDSLRTSEMNFLHFQFLLLAVEERRGWKLICVRVQPKIIALYEEGSLQSAGIVARALTERLKAMGQTQAKPSDWVIIVNRPPWITPKADRGIIVMKLAYEIANSVDVRTSPNDLTTFCMDTKEKLLIWDMCSKILASSYDTVDQSVIMHALGHMPEPLASSALQLSSETRRKRLARENARCGIGNRQPPDGRSADMDTSDSVILVGMPSSRPTITLSEPSTSVTDMVLTAPTAGEDAERIIRRLRENEERIRLQQTITILEEQEMWQSGSQMKPNDPTVLEEARK